MRPYTISRHILSLRDPDPDPDPGKIGKGGKVGGKGGKKPRPRLGKGK